MAHLHISYYTQQMNNDDVLSEKYVPFAQQDCPVYDHQCFNMTEQGLGMAPTYASIVSCSLSVLGSLLIFVAYFAIKGIRNIAQKIITLLALADFLTAVGFLVADWNYMVNGWFDLSKTNWTSECLPGDTVCVEKCNKFAVICEAQSFVTSWSSLSSFGWTCALALHFYLLLSGRRKKLLSTLLVVQNVVIWGFPLLIVLPLLVTKRLGYSRYATSNWCFIRNLVSVKYNMTHDKHQDDGVDREEIALILIGGKLWEMMSYLFVVVVYAMTIWKFRKRVSLRQGQHERQGLLRGRGNSQEATHPPSPQEEAMSGVQQRLLLIPVLFIFLRIWGTMQFLYSLARNPTISKRVCLKAADTNVFYYLGILQALGDGGQGWSNALLYILLSPTMRRQLFVYPLAKCLKSCLERIKARAIREEEEEVRPVLVPTLRISRKGRDSKVPPVRQGARGEIEGGMGGQPRGGKGKMQVKMVTTSDFNPSDWSPSDSGVYNSPNS